MKKLQKNIIAMKKHSISRLINYKYLVLIPLLLAFASYSPRSTYTIPIAAWSVSSADLDLDGDMDIIVGHKTMWQATNKTISVLKNTGNGNFVIEDTLKSFCGYQENIFACKIDNDEYPDLVTFYSDHSSGIAKRFIRVWYNQSGSFNNFKDFSLNSSVTFSDITYGDVNGDNLIDILVLSNNAKLWGVLYNLGNGVLSPPEYHYITGYYPVDIACGDLNGDGRDDVVIAGQAIEIFYSTPSGFQRHILDPMAQKNMVSINDFDCDGYNDLISVADIPIINVTSIVVYRNQGDTILLAMPEVYFQPGSSHFSITDFNNDNLPDIACLTQYPDTTGTGITNTIGGIIILYNQGNFQLSEPQFIGLDNYGEGWRNFHCTDLDGNGYNDFAIVRTIYRPLANNLELLFNDGNGNFISTPVGIHNPDVNQSLAGLRCYPNPFTDETTFEYFIEKTAQVELSVFDIHGKSIQCLTHEKLKGGKYTIQWRGLDKAANQHKPCAFIAYLKVNGKIRQTIKLIKL